MTNQFEAADRAFARYLRENPGSTYAKFSVANQIAFIRRGGIHPTLGQKVQKYNEWWKAGEGNFKQYMQLFDFPTSARVVDYGCGSLRIGAHFIRYLGRTCYFGLDVTMDFIEEGKKEVGGAMLSEKLPQFGPIDQLHVETAANFDPEWVMSTACAFQIHPDEKGEFIRNVKSIAHRSGCTLFFDTKIADEGFRYRNSAWVWPLEFYVKELAPLVLIDSHQIDSHHEAGRDFEARILVFRRE